MELISKAKVDIMKKWEPTEQEPMGLAMNQIQMKAHRNIPQVQDQSLRDITVLNCQRKKNKRYRMGKDKQLEINSVLNILNFKKISLPLLASVI